MERVSDRMKNNIRFDLSDYLIHFFRDVDMNSGSYIHLPEYCGHNCNHHQIKIEARYLIRLAIRNHKIISSWSYRNGGRTIYGKSPAVCFTEMPIAAYLDAGFQRLKNKEKIGLYALLFPKDKMFSVGARPVIYALDSDLSVNDILSDGDERLIDETRLPLNEQYRYVSYYPQKVDWTHEREWRWPFREATEEHKDNNYDNDFSRLPGLNFGALNISGAGVIVPFENDIPLISHDILTLIDRGDIKRDSFKFIIAIESLDSYKEIVDPKKLSDYINSNLLDFEKYFNLPVDTVEMYVNDIFSYIYQLYRLKDFLNDEHSFEYGGVWIWVQDNQCEVVRALVQAGKIIVNKEGHYLIDINLNDKNWTLRKKQSFANYVAKWLWNRYRLAATSFAVGYSFDINGIPTYFRELDKKHPFYNETELQDW